MPKLVCRVGHQPKKYRYSGFRFDRQGFLSVFSFAVSDKERRQEYMERGRAAVIMPVDFKKREIYFVRQPRHVKAFTETAAGQRLVRARRDQGTGSFGTAAEKVLTLELPAGIIDKGETPADAAVRELKEETGLVVGKKALTLVAKFYLTMGCCTETVHGFMADVSRAGKSGACGDGDETIAVWKYTWDEAFRLFETGKIESASSLVLLGHLMRIQDKAKKKKSGAAGS